MIPAEIYIDIYLLFVLILSFLNINNYIIADGINRTRSNQKCVLVLIIVILFIGLRPLSIVFADMGQYAGYLERYDNTIFQFSSEVENIIYDNLMMYLACNGFPYPLYYLLIASIFYGGHYFCFKKIFPNDYYIIFILFLSAIITFPSATNGIKIGAATAFFMIALAYYNNSRVWIIMLLLSFGFHHAMQVAVIAFLCTKLFHKTNIYFVFWLFCLLCAVGHVTLFQNIFANYTDEKGASYLATVDQEWGGKAGFRLDFVIYSAMPVLVGWYSIIKKKFSDIYYERILSIYLLTNGIWMLCMYMKYNNRLASLSWGMYVVVLFYPILRCAWPGVKSSVFRKMAWAHVGFTMAMHYVYYAFIHLNR